jgi:hypothetical protein
MIGLFAQAFLKPDFAKALRDYGESSADLQTGKWKLQVIRSLGGSLFGWR